MESRHPAVPRPEGTELAPATLDGWWVLHQLYRLDRSFLASLDVDDRAARLADTAALVGRWAEGGEQGWSGLYRMTGGGVDLMFVHFRPSLDDLTQASATLASSGLYDALVLDHEYLSVVELGMYGLTAEIAAETDPSDRAAFDAALEAALTEEREKPYVQRRLHPVQPDDMPYVCYYPMDKRRTGDANWYALPLEERAELMRAHGAIGRGYAGRISQVISGSIGLADWEWAVTLWAADPLRFKDIVTEMRYDVASAVYAEFGQFFVGRRMSEDDVPELMP